MNNQIFNDTYACYVKAAETEIKARQYASMIRVKTLKCYYENDMINFHKFNSAYNKACIKIELANENYITILNKLDGLRNT